MNPVATANNLTHLRIRASAGSGKTYQLTIRYLRLLACGADNSSILASTFTRAAAGEIRNRILLRLCDAADHKEKLQLLGTDLDARQLSSSDVLTMLRALTGRISHLQIRTLDSFLASIVQSFALELGVMPGSSVVVDDEAAQLRTEAIRLMLDERNPQELIKLLRLLTRGDSERAVTSSIDRVVSDLYEHWRETDAEAWQCVPKQTGHLSQPELVDAILRLETCKIPDKKSHIDARNEDLERLRQRNWIDFISKGISAKVAKGETQYRRSNIASYLIDAYQPLVAHARAELIGRFDEQTLATCKLLRLYDQQYTAVKRRRSALTFADLTASLVKAVSLGSIDEICFRLDARLRHLLFDEFQDTSITQWHALEPFVREIVSNRPPDYSFFCVGDVKQSIYGWRDAAPQIMERLPEILFSTNAEEALKDMPLSESRRSSQSVINAVNEVFDSIEHNQALAEFDDVVKEWRNFFSTHTTHEKDLRGYVQLRMAKQAADKSQQNSARLEDAAKMVEMLYHSAKTRTIGILVRKNNTVAKLLYELGPTRRNLPATARGGGKLTDDPAVNAILDLLQVADHPGNRVAAFNVANSPLATIVEVNGNLADPNAIHQRVALSQRIRRQLLCDGYGRTIASWTDGLAHDCDSRQLRRLVKLVELADRFDARATLRCDDFIRMIETTSLHESSDGMIQVMTIHQAKGLEFDIVVLPELEDRITGNMTPSIVYERENEIGRIKRICRYMNKEVLALAPDLQPLHDQHQNRTVSESLCVLYVAMTRAKYALYMLINPPKENERNIPKSLAGVLRCALTNDDVDFDVDGMVYETGDSDWWKSIKTDAVSPATDISLQEPTDTTLAIFEPIAELVDRSRTLSPDRLRSPAEALRISDSDATDAGTAIHLLFEQIQWLKDFNADDDTLISIVRRKLPRRDHDWATARVADFRAHINHPTVRSILTHPDDDLHDYLVLRELPVSRLGDHQALTRRIDRLVIKRKDSRAIAARIIDFKTVHVDSDSAAEKAQAYRPQLEFYQLAVADLFKLPTEKINMQLLFVSPESAHLVNLSTDETVNAVM